MLPKLHLRPTLPCVLWTISCRAIKQFCMWCYPFWISTLPSENSASQFNTLRTIVHFRSSGLLSVCLSWSHYTFKIVDHSSFLNKIFLAFISCVFIFFSSTFLSPYSLSFSLVPPWITAKHWSTSELTSTYSSFSVINCLWSGDFIYFETPEWSQQLQNLNF